LEENDLVFIDPPYSGVHYSRFYHVLETIARGECGAVSGVGRYPPPAERPRSRYSVASESREAVSDLLATISARGATAIVTFPDKKCSNGISSYLLEKLGRVHFREVERKIVRGRFSTLGGNGQHRDARQPSAELVLILRP
jgi:adenine-specific DNA methylase